MLKIRNVSFAILLVAFGAYNSASLRATDYDCYNLGGGEGGYMYYGSEVECSSEWKDNACEAFCDLCFGVQAHCDFTGSCDPGVSAAGFCHTHIIEE